MRKYGLTIDQLLSVDLVTAEGELVKASETENADLFWGVRGGGGNFGIVTEFEFRLNPVGPIVLAGPLFWPMEESPNVLRFYREWIAEAPDELMTIVVHRKAPPLPFVLPELHGKPIVGVVCCYVGAVEEGERVVEPLKAFGRPVRTEAVPNPPGDVRPLLPARVVVLHALMRRGGTYRRGHRHHGRALAQDQVPVDRLPDLAARGAAARVGEDETAFGGRDAGHTFNITAATASAEGFDEEREWVRDFWSALEPYHTGAYVNFLMEVGEERVREAYGPEKYDRLKVLKRRWDPENLFRVNQNISPTS
jgi:FAD/FMN-containing dehydrogenase